jgi:hypothetical protein
MTFQWPASISKPSGFVAAIESSPPCLPAVLGPAGEIDAATATSKRGRCTAASAAVRRHT